MNRKTVVKLGLLVLAAAAALTFLMLRPRRPFRELQAEDIASAQVFLQPPNKSRSITDHKALAHYLQNVVLYQKDDSYLVWNQQGRRCVSP